MPFCSNCGKSLGATSNFCPNCGTAIAEVTPEPAAVIVESAPQVYEAPVVPTKAKVLGFVGMGVAIFGLVLAVFGLLYTFIGMAAEETGLGFGMSVGFGLFSLPCSIVGRILCRNSVDMGNCSKSCSVGSKMGIAGIIVSAVMLFFGLITLTF